jgi:hypothetical protein
LRFFFKFFGILLIFLVQESFWESLMNIFRLNFLTLHPFMRQDFWETWSMRWFVLEHADNHILELAWKQLINFDSTFFMLSPEFILLTTSDILIKWVIFVGLEERWSLGDHDKQDDSTSKDINLTTVVRFPF